MYARAHLTGKRTATWDFRALLKSDHRRLEESFEELVAAFRTGDREEAATLWDAFESSLEEHMRLEEQHILPEFAKVDGSEASALVREHKTIRGALSELAVGVDLHCTTADTVERFARMLRDHARREEALMYRWAEAHLNRSVRP